MAKCHTPVQPHLEWVSRTALGFLGCASCVPMTYRIRASCSTSTTASNSARCAGAACAMSRCGLPGSAWLADNRAAPDRWFGWWTLQRRKLPFGLDRPARRIGFGPAKRWFLPDNEVLWRVCACLWWVVDAQQVLRATGAKLCRLRATPSQRHPLASLRTGRVRQSHACPKAAEKMRPWSPRVHSRPIGWQASAAGASRPATRVAAANPAARLESMRMLANRSSSP